MDIHSLTPEAAGITITEGVVVPRELFRACMEAAAKWCDDKAATIEVDEEVFDEVERRSHAGLLRYVATGLRALTPEQAGITLTEGVVVPREPTQRMIEDARVATQAANIIVRGKLETAEAQAEAQERALLAAAYRAMLAASEGSHD